MGQSSQPVSCYHPSQQSVTKPLSSSFPTAQSGFSIINPVEIQLSTALLSRILVWLSERSIWRQLAQEIILFSLDRTWGGASWQEQAP